MPVEAIKPTEERAWRPPHWLAVLSLTGLVVLLLACLEMAARLFTAVGDDPELQRVVHDYRQLTSQGPGWIRFVPDAELGYRLRPNFKLVGPTGGSITRHNADGFRNLEDFTPKDPKVLRIACYGASTTYGVGVADNRETYPAQLETLLNGQSKPAGWQRVEVMNLGVGGYTSRETLGTMKRTLPKLKPDVVLIQDAINDVIPRLYPEYKPDYSHYRIPFSPLDVSTWQWAAYQSHAYLAFAYGLGWIRPLSLQSQTQRPMPAVDEALANLERNPPTGFTANLAEEVAVAQSAGCQVWLLTQPYLEVPEFAGPNEESRRLEGGYRKGLAEHTELVIRRAAESGAGLIRLHELTPRKRAYFTDPIHMSAEGNWIKAALIAEAIVPALPVPAE